MAKLTIFRFRGHISREERFRQLFDAEDVSFESVSEHHTGSEQQTATIDPGY